MIEKTLVVCMFVLFIGIAACSDDDSAVNPAQNNGNASVYIGGTSGGAAVYWKDGKATQVGPGEVKSLAVSGGIVYTAGMATERVTSWKTGTDLVYYTDGTRYAEVAGIAVSGGHVYIAGGFEPNGLERIAQYWLDGEVVELTDGARFARAQAIQVVGSDIYVGGFIDESGVETACYWKNSSTVSFESGTVGARVYSVCFDGSDVYAAGYWKNTTGHLPVYWKNGTRTLFSSSGKIDSIVAKDGVVHMAGYNEGAITYWKNGVPTVISTQSDTDGVALAVDGTDVYIAGGKKINGTWTAMCWKNGQPLTLELASGESYAYSVVIVK